MLPVWVEGTRDLLDVLGPACDDEVGESSHFWVIHKGLLEGFFAVRHDAGMMNSNIQWKVWAWARTEAREHVWYDHFFPQAVTDCEIVSLEV